MIFIFQKCNKFWSISLNTFIKIQPINTWRVHTVILSKLPFNVIIFGEHGKPTRIFDLGVFFSVYYNIFWLFWFSDFYSVKFQWSMVGHVFIFFLHIWFTLTMMCLKSIKINFDLTVGFAANIFFWHSDDTPIWWFFAIEFFGWHF